MGARILEETDSEGQPRYACLFGPDVPSPIPLILFFHGDGPSIDEPASATKLTSFRTANWPNSPHGFRMLAVQGRRLEGPFVTFDLQRVAKDNVDVSITVRFLSQLKASGLATGPIYAVGMGQGGTFAELFSALHPEIVRATASVFPVAPTYEWVCPTAPPPNLTLYRACDAITPCVQTEGWLLNNSHVRDAKRLGHGLGLEPACTTKTACGDKQGTVNHYRWPKEHDPELLKFLSDR